MCWATGRSTGSLRYPDISTLAVVTGAETDRPFVS